GIEQVLRSAQPQVGNGRGGHNSLIADVMDGQHRSGLGKSRYRRINRPQEKRQKGRVPVVAMKYIRHEPQALTALDRGAREQQEASMFIRIKGVEIRTTEQLGAIDEVHRD